MNLLFVQKKSKKKKKIIALAFCIDSKKTIIFSPSLCKRRWGTRRKEKKEEHSSSSRSFLSEQQASPHSASNDETDLDELQVKTEFSELRERTNERTFRNLGRNGLRVSQLGLGTWVTFGGQISDDVAEELVTIAYENGINLFDTAEVYVAGK